MTSNNRNSKSLTNDPYEINTQKQNITSLNIKSLTTDSIQVEEVKDEETKAFENYRIRPEGANNTDE